MNKSNDLFFFILQMKKQQQHLQSTLESFKIDFENIDISCPTNEEQKKFMRANSKTKEGSTVPLPPQIFNEDDYCGVSTCTCAPLVHLCIFCLNN